MEEFRMNRLMMKNIIKLLTFYVMVSLMYSKLFQVSEYELHVSGLLMQEHLGRYFIDEESGQ